MISDPMHPLLSMTLSWNTSTPLVAPTAPRRRSNLESRQKGMGIKALVRMRARLIDVLFFFSCLVYSVTPYRTMDESRDNYQ